MFEIVSRQQMEFVLVKELFWGENILEVVKAASIVEPVPLGGTKPFLIYGEDGNQYYAKFKENPESSRILINEYVCSEIADIFEIPKTENVFIEVSEEFVEVFGEEIEEHIEDMPKPGLHFGSLKLNNVVPITNSEAISKSENPECLSTILLFDHLIGNSDRESNKGNILISESQKRIYAIDHSNAFEIGPLWDATQLKWRLTSPVTPFNMEGYVYSKWTEHIRSPYPFSAFFDNLLRLTDDVLWNIIDETPKEWLITDDEKQMLFQYIVFRRDNIHLLPELLKPKLPYWKGEV